MELKFSNFETDGVADGNFTNSPGVTPTGWDLELNGQAAPAYFGYFNPLDDTYSNTTGLPGDPSPMSGPNIFYFGALDDQQGISQTLASATFEADTDYTLTVAVGTRLDYAVMADLEIDLYAGASLIATEILLAANYATSGNAVTFTDYSLDYTHDAADAGLAGQALKIVFLQSGAGGEVDIDNIRLSAVPEANEAPLLALAGGIFCLPLLRHLRGKAPAPSATAP